MKQKNEEIHYEEVETPPVQQNVVINTTEQKSAGYEWVVAGVLLGVIGWIVALISDKGDGRGGKALGGCILSPFFWFAALTFLGVLGVASS